MCSYAIHQRDMAGTGFSRAKIPEECVFVVSVRDLLGNAGRERDIAAAKLDGSVQKS